MTLTLDEYQKLKQRSDILQRDADRAEGLLQSIDARLKDEFGCNVEQAGTEVEKMKQDVAQLEARCEKLLAKVQEDFPQMKVIP